MAEVTSHPNTYPVTFVVGDLKRWSRRGRALPAVAGLQYLDFDELTINLILSAAPEIVMSPLITRHFDAVDVARILARANFTGRYRAVNDDLPNADLIIAEIAEIAPGLDFAVLTL